MTDRDILIGTQEILDYLAKFEAMSWATALRRAKDDGLPITQSGLKNKPIAYRSKIRAWYERVGA